MQHLMKVTFERVAEKPEGVVKFYYKFDKNEDEALQKMNLLMLN